jgi:hypothetical protein
MSPLRMIQTIADTSNTVQNKNPTNIAAHTILTLTYSAAFQANNIMVT